MSAWVYMATGFVVLIMITWGATVRSPDRQPPHDPIWIICICFIPPVLWTIALYRFLRHAIGLRGNLPTILAAFGVFWFASIMSAVPINQSLVAVSGWLFGLLEPIIVYLSTEAYLRWHKVPTGFPPARHN